MAEEQVLFVRKDKCNVGKKLEEDGDSTTAEDDVWDDTALVQAYDRAVSLAKEEVARRMRFGNGSVSGNESNASNKPRSRKRRSKKEWHVGDLCRAVYSEDGVSYEATVNSVFEDKRTCIIKYVGYDNVEEVPLKLLEPSQGPAVRKMQELAAAQEQMQVEMELSDGDSVNEATCFQPQARESHSARFNFRSARMPSMAVPPMLVPPPPPLHLMNSFPEEDAEAMSAMLMSWYMSGFHTGYYQGLKQAKRIASNGGDLSRNSSRKK